MPLLWGGGGGRVNALSARGWWRGWGGRDSAIEGEVHFSERRFWRWGGGGEERDGEMYFRAEGGMDNFGPRR